MLAAEVMRQMQDDDRPGKMPFDYKGKPGAPDGLEECQHLMEE